MRWTVFFLLIPLMLSVIVHVSAERIAYIGDPVEDRSLPVEDPFPGLTPLSGSHHYTDINGDGIGDMILSYPGANDGAGAVVVYLSGSRNISTIVNGINTSDPIGKTVHTSDIDGDGTADLIIGSGKPGAAVFKSPVNLPRDVDVTASDLILPIGDVLFRAGDISGDGVSDLVYYSAGASMIRIADGPVESPDVVDTAEDYHVGFGIDGLSLRGDIDGDGIMDPVLWGKDMSSSRLLIVGSGTDDPLLNLSIPESIDDVDTGDLDGDGIDDLLILSENASVYGRLFAVFSTNLADLSGIHDSDWNMAGTSSYHIGGDFLLHVIDADGDGADDIVLGAGGYGPETNRLSLYYCGDPRDWSVNISVDSEDASVVEDSGVLRLGRSIYSSLDSDRGSTIVWMDSSTGPVEWDIDGSGFGPAIKPPSIQEWPQNKDLVLDFNCASEGDGSTHYSLVRAPVGTTINGTMGLVGYYPTETDVGTIFFEVKATDGTGTSSVYNHTVTITNIPPILTEIMPSVIQAGSPVLFYMETSEDGYVTFSADRSFPFASLTDRTAGRISGFPLKEDRGSYSMKITITDPNGGETLVIWNFTVTAEDSMVDPAFRIVNGVYSKDSVLILFDVDLGTISVSDVGSSFELVNYVIENSSGESVSGVIRPGIDYISIDPGSLKGNLTMTAWINALGRNYSSTFDLGDRPVEKEGGGSPWGIILVILLFTAVSIGIIAASILFVVERTSYVIQSAFYPGGTRRDDEVVGLIHERPGIGYREISRYIRIRKSDLLITLREMEERRMIYGVFDGPRVRFYPLMGSFRDRPLTLNRYQERIAKELIDRGELDEDELLGLTGMSGSRLKKELSLMDLKGGVTVVERKGSKHYRVNRVQKDRLERILTEG